MSEQKDPLSYICKKCHNPTKADNMEEIMMKEKLCDTCRSNSLSKDTKKPTVKTSVGIFCKDCGIKIVYIGKPCPGCGSTKIRKIKSKVKR